MTITTAIGATGSIIPTCAKANPFRASPSDGGPIGPMHDPQCRLVSAALRAARFAGCRLGLAGWRADLSGARFAGYRLGLLAGWRDRHRRSERNPDNAE